MSAELNSERFSKLHRNYTEKPVTPTVRYVTKNNDILSLFRRRPRACHPNSATGQTPVADVAG